MGKLTQHDTLADTPIFKNMEKIGFKKTKISSNKFKKLNQIFCERKHEEALYTTCSVIYRDILVFKEKGKIIGVAKICFECDKSVIIGTNNDTEEFGQSGDYGKLYKILHENSKASL